FSTGSPNASRARKIGLLFATIRGPPPSALCIVLQFGVRVGRISIVCPCGASAVRCGAWLPRETSTAPPGGMGTGPADATCATTPLAQLFGTSGGSDEITSTTTPASAGVAGPQAGV